MDESELYNKIWSRKLAKGYVSGRSEIAYNLLPNGQRLLDIGCGNGELGIIAKNKFKQIFGIDISKCALEEAHKVGLIVKQVNLNREPVPYEENTFDAVTCLDVIEHVFNPNYLIAEIRRILKPNGILIISFPNVGFLLFRLSLLIGNSPRTSGDTEAYDGGHLHYFTFYDMKKILMHHRFTIVAVESKGSFTKVRKFWPNLLCRDVFIKCKRN
jgi:methionine biosynthesis protein MetW